MVAKKKGMQSNNADSWPAGMLSAAMEFHDWDQDVFMHVAIKVMAGHFEQQQLQVEAKDGIRVWQLRNEVKKLIAKHGNHIGVSEYELKEAESWKCVVCEDRTCGWAPVAHILQHNAIARNKPEVGSQY